MTIVMLHVVTPRLNDVAVVGCQGFGYWLGEQCIDVHH